MRKSYDCFVPHAQAPLRSPWQVRRPSRPCLTWPAPPWHRRKDALLHGYARVPLPAQQTAVPVPGPHGHRGTFHSLIMLFSGLIGLIRISRIYACCSLPWTCSSTDMTCTSSPTEYRAATKKRCLGHSSECAKLVPRSRPARACCSNCRVMLSFSVL